jgi:hypothetical protein
VDANEMRKRADEEAITLIRRLAGALHLAGNELMVLDYPGECLDVIGVIVAGAADLLDGVAKRQGGGNE